MTGLKRLGSFLWFDNLLKVADLVLTLFTVIVTMFKSIDVFPLCKQLVAFLTTMMVA